MKTFTKRLASGAFLLAIALPAAADQVFLDDVIVDGSLCVGFDCVNGESFGFDTIRLKENNMRIHFQDTSTSASFPTNDWRIVANDSSNGGGNYLAFEDSSAGRQPFRVDAGARANALRVDSAGDVGLGTATPVVNLHIVDGNTPTMRLDQNGSSGFTPQIWDVAGNEANFFIRDVTNGSDLPFRIFPAAPNNALTIEASTGDIGLGTTAPAQDLHILRSTGGTQILVENTASGAIQYRLKSDNQIRRIVAKKADDSNQSQIELRDDGNIRFLGSADSAPVCLDFGDSDGGGVTSCTFLDGAINCATGACL